METTQPTSETPTKIETVEEFLKQLETLLTPGFNYVAFRFRQEYFPRMRLSLFFLFLRKLQEQKVIEVYPRRYNGDICTYFKLNKDNIDGSQ